MINSKPYVISKQVVMTAYKRVKANRGSAEIGRDRILLISTHIVEDVEMSCDQIIILKSGTILANAPADSLRDEAKGKIYSVSKHRSDYLMKPYFLIRNEYLNNQESLRILSSVTQNEKTVEPSLEDAYMLYLHGFNNL